MAVKGAPQRVGVHGGLRTGARHVRFGSKADHAVQQAMSAKGQ